ncbi:MAG: acyl-CoA synthetase [Acidimicrobiia bacterium]|nr:acyl-CoA synthetase [Acidimicrobiia bacterium]
MSTRCLSLGDVLEVVADAIPDLPAVITNDGEHTYRQLDERATRLANHLSAHGVGVGDHVGIHAANRIEWAEAFYACFKIRAVPINVNYRYVETELRYLYDNADCVAVIVGPEFVDAIDAVADALPELRHRLVLGDAYESALAAASPHRNFASRSPDDLYIVYTGGTTGMPKGVMWRNEDLILGALNSNRQGRGIEHVEQLGEEAATATGQGRLMSLGPMMHGSAQWLMGNCHVSGGVHVMYTAERFDPRVALAMAAETGTHVLSVIGDAMARPVAEALLEDRDVGKGDVYDLSQMFALSNSGAPLSEGVREQLRRALPDKMILDSVGASETGAQGSRADTGETHSAPRFEVGEDSAVLSDDGRHCGVGEIGKLGRSGHIPLGYYKDPEKTAATFPVLDGIRWVVPGDYARVEDDGTISLLGRGSVSINSGGEKIYPEEVEAALLQHPAVFDASVVGTPNERWGQQVTALVQLREGVSATADELVAHCRTLVADYKSPKELLFVDVVPRTLVGKVDYKRSAALASELLGATG